MMKIRLLQAAKNNIHLFSVRKRRITLYIGEEFQNGRHRKRRRYNSYDSRVFFIFRIIFFLRRLLTLLQRRVYYIVFYIDDRLGTRLATTYVIPVFGTHHTDDFSEFQSSTAFFIFFFL